MTVYEYIKEMSIDEMMKFLYFFDFCSIGHVYCTEICEYRFGNMCLLVAD